MDLLSKNAGFLKMLCGIVGISQVEISTDNPGARIDLTYKRRGIGHKSSFTIEELAAAVNKQAPEGKTAAPVGYTDIADLP